MRFLLSLIYRSRALLLFLLLEGIAFFLIINSHSYQRSRFLNSTNFVTGNLLERKDELTNYFDLREENEYLARQNAQLRNLSREAFHLSRQAKDTIRDSVYQQRYTYVSAEIINSSHFKRKNYVTLDKGRRSGVSSEMGVLSPLGAFGVVKSSSKHFSSVIPLINPQLSISGKLKRTGFFGPLSWDGEDYRFGSLEDIPKYAEVQVGDTVITDARSQIFPAGVLIGTVTNIELQKDQNFYRLQVKYATDFARTEHVTIVKDLMKSELDSLQQSTQQLP